MTNFDAQKMQQPEITGIAYQQGTLQGYEVKEYLLDKWERTCAYCGKTDVPLEVEHIVPKSRGGTNRVSNLTIACRTCNLKKGDKTAEEFGYPHLQQQAKQPLKAAACLNTIRWRIVEQLGAEYTYGYVTKYQLQKNRKGFKPSIRRQRYQLQPHDVVSYNGKGYKVKGVFNYRRWIRLHDSHGKVVNTAIKHVELLKYGKGLVFTFERNN
jgi:hypothetical protein